MFLSFQTQFVRQNTPHPKELKMKAHKLFGKDKKPDENATGLDTLSEESSKPSSSVKAIDSTYTMDSIAEAQTDYSQPPSIVGGIEHGRNGSVSNENMEIQQQIDAQNDIVRVENSLE